MMHIDDIKGIINYFKTTFIKDVRHLPKVKTMERAREFVRAERLKNLTDACLYLKNENITKPVKPYLHSGGILWYVGENVKSLDRNEKESFAKAIEVVKDTFNDNHPFIIADYNNHGYKYYYVYHNGANGIGDFIDYINDAASKLSILQNKGVIFRTIADMYNDYIDDVADWLYVFRL